MIAVRGTERIVGVGAHVLGTAMLLVPLAVFPVAPGCSSPPAAPAASPVSSASESPALLPPGPAPRFRFKGVDGREISSEVALGRNTVIVLLTTYDIPSQAQARFLSGIAHNYVPRTNCFALVVEAETSRPLLEAFVNTLDFEYPVALVQTEEVRKSELRASRFVPSAIVLDRGGRVVWRKDGLATEEELQAVLDGLK